MHRLFVVFALLGLSAPGLHAQGLTASTGVAVYRYAEPGQPTKDIQLWGAVQRPGIYQVELGTDLLHVLTLAGGPRVAAEDDRTVKSMTVRIVRDPGGARTLVTETTLDALTSEDTPIPTLSNGDLVSLTAQTKQRFTWRDGVTITTSLAALAVLVLRIAETQSR